MKDSKFLTSAYFISFLYSTLCSGSARVKSKEIQMVIKYFSKVHFLSIKLIKLDSNDNQIFFKSTFFINQINKIVGAITALTDITKKSYDDGLVPSPR